MSTVMEQSPQQRCWVTHLGRLLFLALVISSHCRAADSPGLDLRSLTLEELGDIEITSVSRHAEPLNQAASSVYIISHEAIVRSGATSLAEMLRLAPNVQVAQLSASRYVITVHGFSGNSQAQSFSNKLLVLIDGRSVYSPLYSGVYWDMSNVVPADIDRIEVISGPGSTLWGANAVNGVINIIRRASPETQGGLAELGAGNQQRRASFRYGGRLTDELTGRFYALGFQDDETVTQNGIPAQDNWNNKQAGFQLDLAPASGNLMSLQGDVFHGAENRAASTDEIISGNNLLARWTRKGPRGAELRVQGYFDVAQRDSGTEGRFRVETWDLDLQNNLQKGRHELVVGGGYRLNQYQIIGNTSLAFDPPGKKFSLMNIFIQDSMMWGQRVKTTAGVKFEKQPYANPAILPTLRISWTATAHATLWTSASRAVRASTPFDRDVVETLGGITFLKGNTDFKSEKLLAYEVGLRIEPSTSLKFSAATFYNDYDDLRSIEVSSDGLFLPLHWGNEMAGHTYGADLWAEYRITPNWHTVASYSVLHERLKFKPAGSQLLGLKQAGNDPSSSASLTSSFKSDRITLDATLRHVSMLPDPHVPAYTELNGRIAWQLRPSVELSISARNLLHRRHQEYGGSEANLVVRDVFANVQWIF